MKMARVFLKPDGNKFVDFGLPDNANMASVRGNIQAEGGMAGGMVFVAQDAIHHFYVMDVPEMSAPNLTVFPGGKSS